MSGAEGEAGPERARGGSGAGPPAAGAGPAGAGPGDAPPSWRARLPDQEATRALGVRLARALAPGDVVALLGDLGAGKTSLAKATIATLGAVEEDDVTSPTFVLAVDYPGRVPVLHVDAYRLAGPAAFAELGFGPLEAGERAALVEWADRVGDALPADRLELELAHDPAGGRSLTATARGPRAARLLAALRDG